MGLSVSNALSIASLAAANPPSTSEAAAASLAVQKTPQPTAAPTDTLQLSEAQQVYNLYNQGQTVPQIAAGLGLTVDNVNFYLGVTNSS
jgi:DNA-binding NarL/FixJ family response regulator